LHWSLEKFRISRTAFNRVKNVGGLPHQVFAHPNLLASRPYLIAYYRNIVAISQKGIAQILFSTKVLEAGRKQSMSEAKALEVATTLNRIISGVIDAIPQYNVALSRQAILAEIGTELQGTWANEIGKGATRAVQNLLAGYVEAEGLGTAPAKGVFRLDNGWTITFAAEPDVAFRDAQGVKQIAIEIKGSLDVAGAQTRYGEAKKSFAKQLAENPRCYTIYLASCFTDAVIEQIKADGQVRDWFNLTSILYDDEERTRFLKRVFHIVHTPFGGRGR
jgi:hypothetical protein